MSNFQIIRENGGKFTPLPNAIYQVMADRNENGTRYAVGEVIAEPGFCGPGKHEHAEHAELFYILEGEFSFFIDGQQILVNAGDLIQIPAGVCHDYANLGKVNARLFGVFCPQEVELYK